MSTTGLDDEFFNVTIKWLNTPTLRLMSTLLNPRKVIPTKENLPRDWTGLAVLTGCNNEEVCHFYSTSDPTLSVLKRWCNKDGSTIKTLLVYLEKLDRFDVCADTISLIESDINCAKTSNKASVDTSDGTSVFITLKDREAQRRGLPPTQYDASILYADEDVEFAKEVVTELEQKYKLQIFMQERDLIAGTLEQEATMKIIGSRYNRLIVILSPAFLQSSLNKHFINYAQYMGIAQRQRKIIPCIYKDCEIPCELKMLHKLPYMNSGYFGNFYEKLYASIIPSHTPANECMENTRPPISKVTKYLETPQPSITTSANSLLELPQPSSNLKEHASLPNLSIETKEVTQKTDDTISTISLTSAQQTKTKKKSKITSFISKKILKKKPIALMES